MSIAAGVVGDLLVAAAVALLLVPPEHGRPLRLPRGRRGGNDVFKGVRLERLEIRRLGAKIASQVNVPAPPFLVRRLGPDGPDSLPGRASRHACG